MKQTTRHISHKDLIWRGFDFFEIEGTGLIIRASIIQQKLEALPKPDPKFANLHRDWENGVKERCKEQGIIVKGWNND